MFGKNISVTEIYIWFASLEKELSLQESCVVTLPMKDFPMANNNSYTNS